MKRIDVKLSKDQVQKLALSTIGFIVLVYVYFSFFLGPLNNSRDTAEAQITELQGKVASSKNELAKTANLEKQADASTKRFAALKALNPEGAPIAWFPPRMKAFFANQEIDKSTTKFETSVAFKDTDLANWMRYNWVLELPQTDFATLGKAVAALENAEPLLSITHISIKAGPEDPQFQQVTLNATTAMVKR
jgi:seryl-tRNA synthetase